jgi:Kef-type K+ transport system membrane component KefB
MRALALALLVSVAVAASAAAATASTAVDVLPVLAALVLILLGGRLGGTLFERLGQPAVLGELLAGILIGNLGLIGFHGFDPLRELAGLELLAQIGVLLLLFMVGLETSVEKMMAVGASAFLVAVLGVVLPMVLGAGVAAWFFPREHPLLYWFVGATLCATSVGITARVLSDLKRTASREGRIILGAAVIDDVLGLIVLAVIAGMIEGDSGGGFRVGSLAGILIKSALFLGGALFIGRWLSKHTFRIGGRMRTSGVLLSIALALCFGLAYLAGIVGLAPIVGAFAAGLIVEDVHYRELRARDPKDRSVDELLEPIATFLVPIFFVLMGMRVNLAVFGMGEILGFACVLTIAAILGKQACSLGVLDKETDRLAVGLGMIPRGEVGLIFASLGTTLYLAGERLVDNATYSAIVVMVIITTLVTPPLLIWRLRHLASGAASETRRV